MAQQEYMPMTHYSRSGAAVETAGNAGTKAIKYGVLTALAVTAALIGGGFGLGWLIEAGSISGASVPALAWVGAAVGTVASVAWSGAIGGISLLSGIFGGAKGASQGAANVRAHNAQADMAQAQLQGVAMEAQVRAMEAQARIADAQARIQASGQNQQQAPHLQAQAQILASNDNQHQGTIEQRQHQLGA